MFEKSDLSDLHVTKKNKNTENMAFSSELRSKREGKRVHVLNFKVKQSITRTP